MNKELPNVSIIINTLNRAVLLQKTLESFHWLKYRGKFEVIVVNGPSTDNTEKVLSAWSDLIRSESLTVANLSMSRNIGICMARGDIVVFIDDDAIPEPEWLMQLTAAYSQSEVGAVGGFVYDYTGYTFQYKYCLVDRLCCVDPLYSKPVPELCFPKSFKFPYIQGCNASFRRSALLEIGGFDEEYEYHADETDVCVRLMDAGYLIVQLPNAYVHHKYAPSNIRGKSKIVSNYYSIIKNKVYFSLKHGSEFCSQKKILEKSKSFIEDKKNGIIKAIREKKLSRKDLKKFEIDSIRALTIGWQRGLEGEKIDAKINQSRLEKYSGDFFPFTAINKNMDYQTIVIISQDYPPNHSGGIATFSKELASGLANLGNIVHVITESADINHVDFQKGVWVHHIIKNKIEQSPAAIKRKIPQHIWDWSSIALNECNRIATHRAIDVVEAPIWNCEGIAFTFNYRDYPLVTSLHTTLYFWLLNYKKYSEDKKWMALLGTPIIQLENELMQNSDAIRANSIAIQKAIESAYDFKFKDDAILTIPLGIVEPPTIDVTSMNKTDNINILYVGRFEYRKGIDVLLSIIPQLVKLHPNISFTLVGDNTLVNDNDSNYMQDFLDKHTNVAWSKRVVFLGKVADNQLDIAYKNCDIFVAPSRFESFGLVYLEAMRHAKPVIGCIAGGIPEVVSHHDNGLLVPPGDAASLQTAINWMIANPDEIKKMGMQGQKLYYQKFTAAKMAQRSIALYAIAKKQYNAIKKLGDVVT